MKRPEILAKLYLKSLKNYSFSQEEYETLEGLFIRFGACGFRDGLLKAKELNHQDKCDKLIADLSRYDLEKV